MFDQKSVSGRPQVEPFSVQEAKPAQQRVCDRIDSRAIQARGRSDDAKEGINAFLEKRPADFPDAVSTGMPPFYPWWDERPFE